jgi:hypothetical protein
MSHGHPLHLQDAVKHQMPGGTEARTRQQQQQRHQLEPHRPGHPVPHGPHSLVGNTCADRFPMSEGCAFHPLKLNRWTRLDDPLKE